MRLSKTVKKELIDKGMEFTHSSAPTGSRTDRQDFLSARKFV